MAKLKALLGRLWVPAFWLGLWAALAALVDSPLLLPGPWAVLQRLAELITEASFWQTSAVSLLRILLGCAGAVLAGTLLAALTCRFAPLRRLLEPLLTMVRATPVASFILLVLIWVGRDVLPSVIVFLMVLPVVWANVSAGIQATDARLLELAHVYRFPALRTVRRVYAPAVLPHFLSACRTGLGLGWKAGVAAEVLTVPKLAIGRMLYESKLYLETTDLFAWTTVVVLCSLLIEKLLMAALGSLARRHSWEGGAA